MRKIDTTSARCVAIVAKLGHPRGPRTCGERDREPAQHARKKQKRDRIGKNEQNIADQADADGKQDCSPPTDLVRQPAEEEGREHRARQRGAHEYQHQHGGCSERLPLATEIVLEFARVCAGLPDFTSEGARLMVFPATPFRNTWFHPTNDV